MKRLRHLVLAAAFAVTAMPALAAACQSDSACCCPQPEPSLACEMACAPQAQPDVSMTSVRDSAPSPEPAPVTIALLPQTQIDLHSSRDSTVHGPPGLTSRRYLRLRTLRL